MGLTNDYEDIPGTKVFNTKRCKDGYQLNMFCKSFDKEENRNAFRADEAAYMDKYNMSPEQRRCVEERDWLGMYEVGGNIYYTYKLAAVDGLTFQELGGIQSHMSFEDYRAMMMSGGRPIDGNRYKSEWENKQDG